MTDNLRHALRVRVNFNKIKHIINPPNLVEIQTRSYGNFLQQNINPIARKNIGLESVFKSIFPIEDAQKKYKIDYISYRLGEPQDSYFDCRIKGTTYFIPIYVKFCFVAYNISLEEETRKIKEMVEEEVFFGDFPLMTPSGYFVINGTERVIVSQLHRSPGVFFLENKDTTINRNQIHTAAIIPQRGSWLEFELDNKNLLVVKVNKKKKISISTFLQALGYSKDEIIRKFYPFGNFFFVKGNAYMQWKEKIRENAKARRKFFDAKTYKQIKEKEDTWSKKEVEQFSDGSMQFLIEAPARILSQAILLEDVFDKEGNQIASFNDPLSKELLEIFYKQGIETVEYFLPDSDKIDSSLRNTLVADKVSNKEDAILEVYRKLRSSIVNQEKGQDFINSFLFEKQYYSLSVVGRIQFNKKFNQQKPLEQEVLDHEDIFNTISHLMLIRKGKMIPDDIDNLKSRRVKTIGELLAQTFNRGMVRLEKNIRERMVFIEEEMPKLQELINIRIVSSTIHDFFATSQLSQFMDQTNPLSEITHKRRLSALGPGGLNRERAGFEVRDVHPSHYGRICPIETPEGASIGLMSSLTIYAKVNNEGFIETPYRKVKDMQLTNEIKYMSALDDSNYHIAQSNALLDENERFIKEMIALRRNSEFKAQPREWAEWIDLSPLQLVSVAASLIPFLEHDDANRALMGSNMQRQAVPLAIPQAPFVGTGIEQYAARDSGLCVTARNDGVVCYVDAQKIAVAEKSDLDTPPKIQVYRLRKYDRSNQNTCINQLPLVEKGDEVKKGKIIADGPACECGELALGKNIRVAFMSWNGYNYEDSLIVSERVLKNDIFTSVHVEKFEATARDTKIGNENITRDIPNISESKLRNLNEFGIINVGCYVKTGDILVGKTTPKASTELTPEEKLLQAIFGEKAADIRDSSLRVPQGLKGVVVDVKIFNRKGLEKKSTILKKEERMMKDIDQDNQNELFLLKKSFLEKYKNLLENQVLQYDLMNIKTHDVLLTKNTQIQLEQLKQLSIQNLFELKIKDKEKNKKLTELLQKLSQQVEVINGVYQDLIEKNKRTANLPQGVNQVVKVYIAVKKKLSVGDKMAGRHGNKGVVSQIFPIEDMPYTEDGEPIDMILNPLSVPSRMNIGQVLETHLGMVAKNLGKKIDKMIQEMKPSTNIKEFIKKIYNSDYISKYLDTLEEEELIKFYKKLSKGVHFATSVFDGAKEVDIRRLMDLCEMDHSGKLTLYDGRTGEKFKQKITVGYKYMCKLYHLVDDKLHARSTGPYSLVTQQPLGGKSYSGGQRFGEMEVWALEAYGAAFTLKEMLTVKSDDIYGRNKVYESIVKGDLDYDSGIPESFRVLVNELRSLCIDLELIDDTKEKAMEITDDIENN